MFLRIEELEIQDVRCFDKLKIAFTDGVNVITGPNGAGKSTILTSIGYGLFGTDYLFGMPINAPDLIKRGKSQAKIQLKFSTPKGRYICKHIIYLTKSNSWKVYKDGLKTALTDKPRESKQVVHDILAHAIDHTIFKNALCSRQGELSFLLDLSVSEREDQINRILGLDSIKRAGQWLSKFKDQVEKELSSANEKIEFYENNIEDADTLKDEIDELEKEEKTLQTTLSELKKERDRLQGEISAIKEILVKITETGKSIEEYETDIEERGPKIDTIQRNIDDKIKQLSIKQADKSTIEKLKSEITNEYDVTQKKLNETKINLESYKTQLNLKKKRIDFIEKSKKDIEQTKSSLLELTKNQNKEEIKQKLQHFESLLEFEKEKLDTLQSKIDATRRHYQTQKNEVDKLEANISTFSTNFSETFDSPLENFDAVKKQIKAQGKDIEQDTEQNQKHIEEVNSKINQLEGEKSIVIKTLELVNNTVTDAHCPVCNKQFSKEDSEEMIKIHSSRLEVINSDQKKLLLTKTNLENDGIELEDKLTNFKEKWRILKSVEKELDIHKQKQEDLKLKQNELNNIKKQLETEQAALERAKSTDINTLKANVTQLRSNLQSIQTYENSITTLNDRIKGMAEDLNEINEKLAKLDENELLSTKNTLGASIQKFERQLALINDDLIPNLTLLSQEKKELISNERKLKETQKKLTKLQTEISGKDLKFLEDKYQKIQAEHHELGKQSGSIETKISELNKRILRIEETTKELKSLREKKEHLESLTPIVKQVNNTVNNAPGLMIEKTASEISSYLTNMVKRLLPGRGYQKAVFMGNADVQLYKKNEIIDKGTLSGGEKTVLALALRMALADYVAPMKFLILDEPTNHLDRERIEEFLDIIDQGNLFKNSHGQLILVTHREEFDRNAQHSIQLSIVEDERQVLNL